MKYGILFATAGVLLADAAVTRGGACWILLWPAASCLLVASGYLLFGPRVYGKSPSGLLSPLHQFLLFPFLAYLWSVWSVLRLVKHERPFDQLTDRIFIGRRLLNHEVPKGIDHVVDLTCEFNAPAIVRGKSYFSFQVLDGVATTPERLSEWVRRVAQLPGTVYIHCAEGHGRTGLLAAALLLSTGQAASPEEALQLVKAKRPLVRLGQRQMAALRAFHQSTTAQASTLTSS